jgi:two-component system cell cycle sensor histidine kinase/response regulator CckA
VTRPASEREVAHDFNNLLTAIIGAADAVLERSEIDPETRADIAHIREGARRGAVLVQRLRDDTPAPPDLISVNDTIRATYRLLDHRLGANVTLALDLAEPGGQVMADPSQLDRTLLNLIANARHAMPNGGTVTVGTARRVVAVAEPRVPDTVPPGDYVVITVADTGSGIPRDQISRIFEAGFSSRRHTGGSGLGLSSARDIVRQSNGFLAVESIEGRGTRFEIYLPRVESAPPPAVPEAAPMTAARTVLLVEDDLLVRHVAERALRRAGWTVLCADSAEDALEVLNESACDLVISDIAMPGMDGVALARLVLARQPGLPVILTSGYAHDAVDDGGEVPNVVFLTKPYGQAELLAAVAGVAGARAVRSPPVE